MIKRALGNLSLARKLILLMVLPMITVAALSYRQFTERADRVAEMDRVQDAALLSVQMNSFIHEAQRERGSSGLFLQSKGSRFRTELASYRQSSDEKRAALDRYVRQVVFPRDPELASAVSEASATWGQIAAIREAIDLQKTSSADALAYYTQLITGLLAVQGRFT